MKFYGQLEKASLEVLSSNPTAGVQGRFWFNSTSGKVAVDDGTNIRYMLRNDQNIVIGNNGTAGSNVRFNRSAAAVLQLVIGSDTTAEGSASTTLAQFGAKQEGYATGSKPANGNAGRIIWLTDTLVPCVDNGTTWANIVDVSTAQTLTNKTLTAPAVDVPLFTDQGSDPSAPAAGKTTVYTKGAHVYKISNGGSAVQLAEVGVTNPETVQIKSSTYSALNSDDLIICSGASWSLTLYDCTTAAGNKGKKIRILHQGTSLSQVYTILTTSAQTVGGVASGSYALYTNGEALSLVSDGTNWQILDHTASTSWTSLGATSLSATSAYVFTVTAANATVGAIYSNNGFLYTVTTTITGTTTLTCSGTGTPGTSGTLTKVSGTGDSTITFSARTITGQPVKGTGITADDISWRRSGSDVFIRQIYYQGVAGTAGSGDYIWFLPFSADTTTISLYNGAAVSAAVKATNSVGSYWLITNSSAGAMAGGVILYGPNSFRLSGVLGNSSPAAGAGTMSSSLFGMGTGNLNVGVNMCFPVSGWQP